MILINKLNIYTKDPEMILFFNNLIRDENGDVNFNVLTKIPPEIANFENAYGKRFDSIINDIVREKGDECYEENKDEIMESCDFLLDKEKGWIEKAVELTLKYDVYTAHDYFKKHTSVNENVLPWDSDLPKNSKTQFSFYTMNNPPENWAAKLSDVFPDELIELRYKEKSQLKYKLMTFKKGMRIF